MDRRNFLTKWVHWFEFLLKCSHTIRVYLPLLCEDGFVFTFHDHLDDDPHLDASILLALLFNPFPFLGVSVTIEIIAPYSFAFGCHFYNNILKK